MKKAIKILVIICVSICANFSHSQQTADTYERNFKLGVALNGGLPFNDPYSLNLGSDIRLQYNISTSYALCFTVGYNNLSIQDNIQDIGAGNIFADSNGSSLSYIPIKVGYKTFLFQNEFYVMGEIGGAFSTSKAYDANSLMFSPSVGYAGKLLDISIG